MSQRLSIVKQMFGRVEFLLHLKRYIESLLFTTSCFLFLALAAKRQVMIGKPDLGGDWTLIDHHGERRTNKDFLGQWVILYFGFSFCPDICPEQMEKLVEAVDRIGKFSLVFFQPIFYS